MKLKLFFSLALFVGLFFAACKGGADKNQAKASADPNATYACPMHPEVTGKAGDKCSKCGMALEPVAGHADEHVFACPMHPEVTGKEGDKCPKCGMALVHSDPPAGGAQQYKVTFTAVPSTPVAGQPAKLTFTPGIVDKPGQAVPLDVVHEKKMHLIMVSSDLAWFDHQHPEYNGTGLDLTYTFPKGGDYLLFADYAPAGGKHQVEKIPVTVSGSAAKPTTFTATRTTAKVDGYEVTLMPEGGKWLTNNAMHITGTVKQAGKPLDVNTFENYLGAKAHVVMVGLANKNYEHVHPDVEGSSFDLHTEFAAPGIYRAWLQFQTSGKVHTADFVIQVEEGKPGELAHPEGHEDHDHKEGEGHDEHKH